MSQGFEASNGWHIDEDGDLVDGTGSYAVDLSEVAGARAFFLEERDHELGRWRDKENPDYVVYPKDRDFVVVIDESTGASVGLTRDDIDGFAVSTLCVQVAKRYFAAHPQHKPLPTTTGLYVAEDMQNALEFARLFRLTYRAWEEVRRPEDAPETVLAVVQELHDNDGLVRLVPEGGDDE